MMTKDKRRGSRNKNHFKAPYQEDEQNLLQEVMQLLGSLFDMRLVERISRPIDKKTKEEYISKFGEKLQFLHAKLTKIRTQFVQINTHSENGGNIHQRNKSVLGQATTKPDDWKKVIRNIQNKYSEVLVDGSFKHYRKVLYFLGLTQSHSMTLINIEEWAAACLDNRTGGNCC